ncbi:hypothetical protein HK405_008033, partial [Cladochytrium tenue]
MPTREFVPTGFHAVPTAAASAAAGASPPPVLALESREGSRFELHVLDHHIVRVVHRPPSLPTAATDTLIPQLTTHAVVGAAGVAAPELEYPTAAVSGLPRDSISARFPCPPPAAVRSDGPGFVVETAELAIGVRIDPDDGTLALDWAPRADPGRPFLQDLPHRAYPLQRGGSLGARHLVRRSDTDLHYGLAERASPATLLLNGRRFRLEALDAMGYDAARTDPLYKHLPFHVTLDAETRRAHAVYYDSACVGAADFGCEIDAFWGKYRSFSFESGSGLDMYVIYGPSMARCVEGFASVVGRPALPPKYALGYLASSMGYAESEQAQQFIAELPALCRTHDIPCDLLHLSSGYT